jgi:hypothetical protein
LVLETRFSARLYGKRSVSFLLTYDDQQVPAPCTNIRWTKGVPIKVSVFVWILLNKRLPTKDNMAQHDIVSPWSLHFSGGCGLEKSMNHLFLNCNFFREIWYSILMWLGIHSVLPSDIVMHLLQFVGGHHFRKDVCLCF